MLVQRHLPLMGWSDPWSVDPVSPTRASACLAWLLQRVGCDRSLQVPSVGKCVHVVASTTNASLQLIEYQSGEAAYGQQSHVLALCP